MSSSVYSIRGHENAGVLEVKVAPAAGVSITGSDNGCVQEISRYQLYSSIIDGSEKRFMYTKT